MSRLGEVVGRAIGRPIVTPVPVIEARLDGTRHLTTRTVRVTDPAGRAVVARCRDGRHDNVLVSAELEVGCEGGRLDAVTTSAGAVRADHVEASAAGDGMLDVEVDGDARPARSLHVAVAFQRLRLIDLGDAH